MPCCCVPCLCVRERRVVILSIRLQCAAQKITMWTVEAQAWARCSCFFQCIRFTHHSHSQRTCAHNDTRIDKIHRGDTFRYRLSKYVHRLFGWFFFPVQIHENRITEETKICGQIAEHWVFTTVQKLAFLFGMHCACIGMHCVKSYHVETKINTKKKTQKICARFRIVEQITRILSYIQF